MNNLVNRVCNHWKTTVGGLLSCAGVVFSVLAKSNPSAQWVGIGAAIVAGFTGLMAKDS